MATGTADLKRMYIGIYPTKNMYADMERPIYVGIIIEDAEARDRGEIGPEFLVDCYAVYARVHYLGGDSEPWVKNFTVEKTYGAPLGLPGPKDAPFYEFTFEHTGAGDYNITVWAYAEGYEPAVNWTICHVKPARPPPPPFPLPYIEGPGAPWLPLAIFCLILAAGCVALIKLYKWSMSGSR